MIIGYKSFKKDLTNHYGLKFEVGQTYQVEGEIKFGTKGNGFHMCKNLEDTLRYFDTFCEEISICIVEGSGNISSYEDDYYGYYDMYSVEQIKITKQLTRKEIINIGLNLNPIKVLRFIQGFKLTKEEIILFKEKFHNYPQILNSIAYYQEGNITIYEEKYTKKLIKK